MTVPPTHSDLEYRLRSHYKAEADRVQPRPLELDQVLDHIKRASSGNVEDRQQPVEGLPPIVVEQRNETILRRWPRRHLGVAGSVAAAVVMAIVAGAFVLGERTERNQTVVPAAAPTIPVAA